ncbi:MAG: glycosyltransferase family 4 protein [Acidobacteriota bacterium]
MTSARLRTVLHLRASSGWAGPERHLWELAPGLATAGYRLRPVLLTRQPVTAFERLAELDPLRVPDRFDAALDAACEALAPALVHSHGYKANHWALRLARRHRIPAVATYHLHTRSSWRLVLHAHRDRRRLARFDAVVDIADRGQQDPALARVTRGRLHRAVNGFDGARFSAGRRPGRDLLRELGLPADEPRIVGIGRLSRQKGFSTLIAAIARLAPGVQLLLAGEGPRRRALGRQAERLGVAERVHFLGHRRDVADLLTIATVVALPSRQEGLPYAALEAMALGRPLVTTPVGGLPRLLDHGRCGRLVPPDDVEALTHALEALLDSPAERRHLASRAQQRVEEHYSASAMARAVAEVYDRLLAGGAGGAS